MDKVEKYIEDYTRHCSNELAAVEYTDGSKVTEYHEWLTPDNARAAVSIAKGKFIDNACDWLTKNAYLYADVFTLKLLEKQLVEEFRKAMEE